MTKLEPISANNSRSIEVSLFHEAIAKVEDPRRKGMYIANEDGHCHLSMVNPASGRLSKYEVVELFADLQSGVVGHQQIGPKEIADKKLYIFMYSADFGPKAIATSSVLPETPGTFQVYTLSEGASNPHLIAASVGGDQLDLAAIGIANRKKNEPFGLRAVYYSSPTPFGVATVATTKEMIALWYRDKLGNDKARAFPTNEEEQGPRPLPGEYRWGGQL